MFASNWDWRTKDSQLLFLERTCSRKRLETTSTTILSKKSKISASKNLSEDGIRFHQKKIIIQKSYDSSVVKALDLKSDAHFPRTIEPCSQPSLSLFRKIIGRSWQHESILVFASNWDWRTKDSQLLFLERTCSPQRLETTSTARQSSATNWTKTQTKISPRTELTSIQIREMSTELWWPSG